MFIINEDAVFSKPKNIKSNSDDYVRFEAVIQTSDVPNRNGRVYPKKVIKEGLVPLRERLNSRTFIGELDHPLDSNPVRQVSILFTCSSHRFLEMGWDGNKLISVMETLHTPNGKTLYGLIKLDKLPVGFSFRGMGELRKIFKEGKSLNEVMSPLHICTFDCVSHSSHIGANLTKVIESDTNVLQESMGLVINNDEQYKLLSESFSNVISQDKDLVYTKGGIVDVNLYEEMIDTYARKLNNVFGKRNK